MREKDRSGLRAAIRDEKEGLGAWVLLKVSRIASKLSLAALRGTDQILNVFEHSQGTSHNQPPNRSPLSLASYTLSST